MILLLDNFDSFTYNLRDYLFQVGLPCIVQRSNVTLDHIISLQPRAIVLSPGPGKPSQAGVMPEVIQYYHQKLPILGVCLGHQAIGEFFGAKLVKAQYPMHGKLSQISCFSDPVFQQMPDRFAVTRYHSLILTEVSEPLKTIAATSLGEVMAIKHQTFPCYGIQYHPEAFLTEYGLQFLHNWAQLFDLTR